MVTAYFIIILSFAIVLEAFAVFLLACGIYTAITKKDIDFCIGAIVCFLLFSGLSGLMSVGAYSDYQDTKPQNQVKILKQKILDAEKALQKYLIDHPELKEEISYDSDCPKRSK